MLSLQEIRESLNNPDLDDTEISALRDDAYLLANVFIDMFIENKKISKRATEPHACDHKTAFKDEKNFNPLG